MPSLTTFDLGGWWRLPIATVVALSLGCGSSVAPAGIAIENVTLVDAVAGVRENQRVVIHGDRIVSVSDVGDASLATTETVDGRGRFLIPGLWDMHAHFFANRELTDAMPGLFLKYGITSVRDTGGLLADVTALRKKLDASDAPAPRVFIAGPLLDGEFVVYDGGDPGRPLVGISVTDGQSARERVRELKDAGADFIKIYELVTPEVFEALADEARRLELPIAAHVPLTMTADVAGPHVDSMEHFRNIEIACASNWEELLAARRTRIAEFAGGRGIELRSELHGLQRSPAIESFDGERCETVIDALRDTVQVPTLRLNRVSVLDTVQRSDWERALAGLPPSVRQGWEAQAARARESGASESQVAFAEWQTFLTGRLREQGVPFGAGTDTPIGLAIPGYSLHTELARLVDVGLTPVEALYTATVQPAKFFGLDAEMGQIQPGMRADLVLLDGNPVEDIENTRRIVSVMSQGEWVD